MIRKNMNIPIYNYKLNVVELEDTGDADIVTKMLKKADMDPDFIAEIVGDLRDEARNGGWTLCHFGRKHIFVILLPMTSEKVRRRVLHHELRHVADDILGHADIKDKEAAAYLAGFLAENVF